MIFLVIFLVASSIGLICALRHKHDKALFYESFLKPIVFISIGLNGILLGFIPHVFFADAIAAKIGSPGRQPVPVRGRRPRRMLGGAWDTFRTV